MEGLAADLPAKSPKNFITQTGSALLVLGVGGWVTLRLLVAREDNESSVERVNSLILVLHIFPADN